ncbi:MAG: sulfatase-like hydrolase/transferase [FCB group bacterium]|nr:sulfatase-like hydrolase/transferase [FCB group bacterium]
MKRLALIHPLLFGMFPILFLYAQNAQSMNLADIGPALGMTVITICGLVPLAALLLRSLEKGALAVTFLAVLFFSYGHVVDSLPSFKFLISKSLIGPNGVILPIYCLLLIAGIRFVARTKKDLGHVTKILAQLGLLLVAMQVAHGGYIIASRPDVQPDESVEVIDTAEQSGYLPDIYYIVMDAFGREDILKDVYGVDISNFTAFLRERGFFVADNSYSNYMTTLKSLAATMNFDYVQNIESFAPDSRDRVLLARRLWENKVFRKLKALGYTTAAFSPTGSSYTESIKADIILQASGGRTEFETLLIATLPLPLFLSEELSKEETHRRLVLSILEKIPHVTDIRSPKIVFAHVFCPHKPFVFGPDGGPNENILPGAIVGSGDFKQHYISCYSDQVTYMAKRLQQTITEILDLNRDNPPIIIVQGDHGPRAGMNWYDMSKTNLKEVLSIINAMYLPGVDYNEVLNNDMSSVNTFRILFNEYFNTDYEMLPNKHYYCIEYKPFDYQLIKPEQLAQNRNAFDYLLESDFDGLSTLERIILLAQGQIDRPLNECYVNGQPQMSFGGGALHLADSRITKVAPDQYLFEVAFVPRGLQRKEYSVELCFYPQTSDKAGDTLQHKEQLQLSFTPSTDSVKIVGQILRLPFDPAKFTVAVSSAEQAIKADGDNQPIYIPITKLK